MNSSKMLNPLDTQKLIDTHCHLNDSSFDTDRDEVIARAREAGVEAIIDMGVDLITSKKAVENSKKYKDFVYASIGIDAETFVPGNVIFDAELFSKSQIEIGNWISSQILEIEKLIDKSVVMIGECGMDYHWLNENKELSEEDKNKSKLIQKLLFASQIELAAKHSLPLSIHSRGAESDCIEMIGTFKRESKNEELKGSFHSFTGTLEEAKRILELGFKIGVNGIVTYKKAENVREMVEAVGIENVVFETDSPYLTPTGVEPVVKGRNEPASVVEIRKYVEKMS